MTAPMQTSTISAIEAEDIQQWITRHLSPLCPAGAEIKVINRPWHCKGESAFFAAVDVDAPISISQLRDLEVIEHTRAQYLHFYVDDVISAAVGSGALDGSYFHVYYRW